MTESQATTKILKVLKEYGFFWKASDRFRAGIPDIIGVYTGRFVAIEMKLDYNKATPLQVFTMKEMRDHAAYCLVVTYCNKDKSWSLAGRKFPTAKATALHIVYMVRFNKDTLIEEVDVRK